MWNGPPRRVRGDPTSQPEELPEVSGTHQGMVVWTSALEAARPATPTDGDAAWLLSVLRITSLQTATGRCKARGRPAVDSGAAQTQPASPAVLVLSPALFVVRTAVCGDTPRGCVKALVVNATWGARCRKSARRVLRGGTGTRSHAGSVKPQPRKGRIWRGSAKATAPRPVPTSHNMSHEWTMKFIKHRVADRGMLRLIQKWLKAGVSEDGQWSET